MKKLFNKSKYIKQLEEENKLLKQTNDINSMRLLNEMKKNNILLQKLVQCKEQQLFNRLAVM